MTVEMVFFLKVTDPAGLQEYLAEVPAVVAKYGGVYSFAGPVVAQLEGEAIDMGGSISFPDAQALKEFYSSDEYAPYIAIRQRCATTTIVGVQNVVGAPGPGPEAS